MPHDEFPKRTSWVKAQQSADEADEARFRELARKEDARHAFMGRVDLGGRNLDTAQDELRRDNPHLTPMEAQDLVHAISIVRHAGQTAVAVTLYNIALKVRGTRP